MTEIGRGPAPRDAPDAGPDPLDSPDKDLGPLRDAVVDAATVTAGLWLSYLGVLFYFLVGAAGVTQRDLFLDDIVNLPFLNGVQLPLVGFASLAPIIFVVSHAYLMLHLWPLASKVRAFDEALARVRDPAVRSRWREQLPLNTFTQLFAGPDEVQRGTMAVLLGLTAFVTLVFGPVALLVFFVLHFLPAHNQALTWLQRLMVLADLMLLWLLGPWIASRTRRWPPRRTPAAVVVVGAMVLLSGLALATVFVAATYRGEWLDTALAQVPWLRPEGLQPTDYLFLDHANLSGDTKPSSGAAASLEERDLDRSVLTNSTMQRFDFTGARLRGANLDFAQLQGSNLNQAQLQGASLVGAKLHGATLDHASLAGANLASAQLQGANLSGADLTGANLEHAQLQGAVLDEALLEGAILDSAQLQGASLAKTQLQGASLQKAFVWRADPAQAALEGARLGDLVFGPQQACDKAEGCSWNNPVDKLQALLKIHVSDDDIDSIVQRLEARFRTDAEQDTRLERAWRDLKAKADAVAVGTFGRTQAMAWRFIGCTTADAPFVATQMASTLRKQPTDERSELPALAGVFLDPTCEGARGMPADVTKALTMLRDHPDQVATESGPDAAPLDPAFQAIRRGRSPNWVAKKR